MFIGSPTRDLFDYSVERIAVVVLLLVVLVAVGVPQWAPTSLIDAEEDRTLRAVLVGMLREAERNA